MVRLHLIPGRPSHPINDDVTECRDVEVRGIYWRGITWQCICKGKKREKQ